MTPDTFITALRQRFAIERRPATPARRGEVSMFLGGRYTIVLDANVTNTPAERLDVTRPQDVCWHRCSGSVMCGLISGSTLSRAHRGAGVAGPFRRGGRCVFVISGRRAKI